MKIAIVPSNQHQNIVAGDPNPAPGSTTEEMIAVIRGLEAMAELTRQGHTGYWAYIPGAGSSSVDELVAMLDWMMAAKPDYVLSFHSDAGGVQDVFPLVCRAADLSWADAIGRDLDARIGFAHQSPTVRTDLAFCHRVIHLPTHTSVLLEIGEHGSAKSSVYGMPGPTALWKYARFHGLMATRSFLKGCGLLKDDGPVPADVAVPPGAAFDRYRPGALPPVVPVADKKPVYTRLLKYVKGKPYMRGDDVRWVQTVLVEMKLLAAKEVDGIYGSITAAAVRAAQQVFWPKDKSEWDGIVGQHTWAALIEAKG